MGQVDNQSVQRNEALGQAKTNQDTSHIQYAKNGDTLADIGARHGVDAAQMERANPDIRNGNYLLAGQTVKVPHEQKQSDLTNPAVAGVSGSGGRESMVQSQMDRAYRAGNSAPQEPFNGDVQRSVPTRRESGVLNTKYPADAAQPQRYNDASTRAIYTSDGKPAAIAEAHAYQQPDQALMADRTLFDIRYTAQPDASGRGGVANLNTGMAQEGFSRGAFATPKGGSSPSATNILLGEHPYTLPQQAAKGAADAGASAVRAPSAVGPYDQIDILPRNTNPSQLQPNTMTRYDANGVAGATQPAVANPMPVNDLAAQNGKVQQPAGGGVANQGKTEAKPLVDKATGQRLPANELTKNVVENTTNRATGAADGHPRASSVRYGAAGGAAGSLINDSVRAFKGENVSTGEVVKNAATSTVVGSGAAKVTDALTPKLGGVRAGGVVAGVIEAGTSTVRNAELYKDGKITAAQATANTTVDVGVAVAAGASGAGLGAVIGTAIFPGVGTAGGAAIGFVAGMGTHYAIQAFGAATGAFDKAKAGLADALTSYEKPLGQAWNKISDGVDSVKQVGSDIVNGAKDVGSSIVNGLGSAASALKFW
jgi:LysM repeat protein